MIPVMMLLSLLGVIQGGATTGFIEYTYTPHFVTGYATTEPMEHDDDATTTVHRLHSCRSTEHGCTGELSLIHI